MHGAPADEASLQPPADRPPSPPGPLAPPEYANRDLFLRHASSHNVNYLR
jgi:hypothetical protein